MNAVPISLGAPTANGQDSVVILNRAELDVVLACRAEALRRSVVLHRVIIYQALKISPHGERANFKVVEGLAAASALFIDSAFVTNAATTKTGAWRAETAYNQKAKEGEQIR